MIASLCEAGTGRFVAKSATIDCGKNTEEATGWSRNQVRRLAVGPASAATAALLGGFSG
jgi:hypothetical protein